MVRLAKGVCLFLVLVFLSLSFCGNALAARGRFSSTCTDIRLSSDDVTLTAECKMSDDKGSRRTSLDIGGQIVNRNGKLMWEGGGNYHRTCRNEHLDVPGDVELVADCKTYDGNYIRSELNLDDTIENDNGALKLKGGSCCNGAIGRGIN